MRQSATAFLAGLLFAVGLGIAGMTLPQKVKAFLDVAGQWDPSLLLVMVGAISVYMPAYWLILRQRRQPLLAERFSLPASGSGVDGRLVSGAALFGGAWGVAGLCPGPAAVGLMTGRPEVMGFFAAMLLGMFTMQLVDRIRANGSLGTRPKTHASR